MNKQIDWDNLSFCLTPTNAMFIANCDAGDQWQPGKFVPFGHINISPASPVLNYGQGIFEGLKAHRTKDNEINLFRPEENAKRFARGADSLCMPAYPVDEFLQVIEQTVLRNLDYVPPYKKGSLYIRPCLWGVGDMLGINSAPQFTFIVYTSPVGNYYKGDLNTIKLLTSTQLHRCAPKGLGHVKFIGNYAPGIKAGQKAKADGYNGLIYLDAREDKYIEEVGTSNFFCVIGNRLITPQLGSILPGITRDSIITIARELLGMQVEEKRISVDEALAADECFCCGTAATITAIGSITHQANETIFNNAKVGDVTRQLYTILTQLQISEYPDHFSWITKVGLDTKLSTAESTV